MKVKFYMLICLYFLCACAESKRTNSSDEGYLVYIDHAAGDDYIHEGHAFISYPFHDATFKLVDNEKISCAIIGKKIPAGKKIRVLPRAMLTYEEDREVRHCIVAVPTDTSLMNVQIDNFSDFMLKYAPIRNIIELWQLNKCGIGCAKMINWKDENASGLLLEQNLER